MAKETKLFEILSRATYSQPYQVDDVSQFLRLTELAEYYLALPILSRTLDGALINSPDFCNLICGNASRLFVAAAKLRNALLSRECLIWVVNPFMIHNTSNSKIADFESLLTALLV
jgi:hypothetical protein